MSSVFKRRKFLKIGSQCANILLNVMIRRHFFRVLWFEMDYVPKLAKNNLYVAIQGSKSRTSIGTMCLSLVNIPITLDIFNDMWSIWLFQFKCLLIINPRNLKLLTQSILFPSIIISGSIIFVCGWWNNMHFDLGTFRDNLVTLNQIVILHNSLFVIFKVKRST